MYQFTNCLWTMIRNVGCIIAAYILTKPLFYKNLDTQKLLLYYLQSSCDGGHVVLVTHFAQGSGIEKLDSVM